MLPQLPDEVREIITSAPEAEYATLSSAGMPIANPLFHYYGPNGTIDVATGIAYPAKAERAKRNPRVGLLFAPDVAAHDPVVRNALPGQVGSVHTAATSRTGSPVALVAAVASVQDTDIQANTDRYVRDFTREHPLNTTWEQEQLRVWYYARIYIECTPVRVLWWPEGLRTGEPPRVWSATDVALSDAAPASGPGGRGKQWPAPHWREAAERVVQAGAAPTLTVADADGFPLPFPTLAAELTDTGFDLELPTRQPWTPTGQACLTFTVSATFLGTASQTADGAHFAVDRVLGNLPLSGNDQMPRDSDEARSQLMERLARELAKRGQPVPQVRLTPEPA